MLQEYKIALFQQIVLKGFYYQVLLEGTTNIDRKLLRAILS